jgi:hypothetical protein
LPLASMIDLRVSADTFPISEKVSDFILRLSPETSRIEASLEISD